MNRLGIAPLAALFVVALAAQDAFAQDRPKQGRTAVKPIPFLAAGVTPADLEKRVTQFAPAPLDFDATILKPWEKQVLKKLVDASRVIHEIYFVQVSTKNAEYKAKLDRQQGAGKAAAEQYFDIMVGPWDRLEHDAPFLDVGPKPKGAGFYPTDLTSAELETYIQAHPAEKEAIQGYFTVIRRDPANPQHLITVPYAQAYHDKLVRAATLLREAAALSKNASLTDFLRKRADAFLSDDYYSSDVAWMDIQDSRIEPTIGPYEVYEDELAGYKASYESYITIADPAAGAELQTLKNHLQDLERQLPIDDRFKSPNRPFESPIRVVDVAYTSGDGRRGVQTTAFNLPNDSRVIEQKGSKKVMLRNTSHAKFSKILAPISKQVLDAALVKDVSFHPWFIAVVMHELAHGLGPSAITLPSGEKTTVNRALKENYSAIEECKADVTGLHNLTVLAKQGVYTNDFVRQAFVGHMADLFRAVRFGTSEAHGKANLIQFNYLMEKGALRYNPATKRFGGDLDAIIAANRQLAGELLTLEGEGSYEKAAAMVRNYGTNVRPELSGAIERLKSVPVDIRPRFPVLEKMRAW
jgi:hypothetical protein